MTELPTSPALASVACQSPPATSTFVVRLWQVWTGDAMSWRGWIEHVPSGERAAVQDWQEVEAFVSRFGVGSGGTEG